MANILTFLSLISIIVICLHIEFASALKPRLSRNIRPSKRTLGSVDLDETLKNGVNAFKGIGAVMEHTAKGELQSLKAKEPGTTTSGFGTSTADLAPAGGDKKT